MRKVWNPKSLDPHDRALAAVPLNRLCSTVKLLYAALDFLTYDASFLTIMLTISRKNQKSPNAEKLQITCILGFGSYRWNCRSPLYTTYKDSSWNKGTKQGSFCSTPRLSWQALSRVLEI